MCELSKIKSLYTGLYSSTSLYVQMTKDFFDKTTKNIFLSQQVADDRIMILLNPQPSLGASRNDTQERVRVVGNPWAWRRTYLDPESSQSSHL